MVAVIVFGSIGTYFLLPKEPSLTDIDLSQTTVEQTAPSTDTLQVTSEPQEVKPEIQQQLTSDPDSETLNGKGTIDLGYGIYTGELKNGKPHGYGKITYKTKSKIISSKDFIANPGDTFEGDFRDGKISGLGYWDHDGNKTAVKP